MGLIFLRHATNRFYAAKAAIAADKAAGKMPDLLCNRCWHEGREQHDCSGVGQDLYVNKYRRA